MLQVPEISGDAPVLLENETVAYSTPSVRVLWTRDDGESIVDSVGFIFVTNQRVVFVGPEPFQLEYSHILLHAQAESDEFGEHLYTQLSIVPHSSDVDQDDEPFSEMRIVAKERWASSVFTLIIRRRFSVRDLFNHISSMSALNPDDSDDESFEAPFDVEDAVPFAEA